MEGYTYSSKNVMIMVLVMCMIGSMVNGQICNMPISGLYACKPYVSNSVASPGDPSINSPCCKAVKGANIDCLCGYKNSAYLPMNGIDPDKAMKLPVTCKAKDPSWQCPNN
ncbi:hypothetical protein PIB30_006209 [Stylosanthes scabra]|uniref:Bifunctional inhibitor/plant lipid transfer protein/seed storage helical domain-containing protein n=1 Tax=Stylosanthes scabra TaxID=79078 RepID=A0ABU6Y4L5_9FABA|nr:hypothetical protein [Stylosanthes scabra]